MKNLIQYRFRAETIFYHFLNKGLDINLLERSLYDLEQFIRESEGVEGGLWFRFFDSDNGAHTIPNIIEGLKSFVNKDFYMECLQECIGLNVQHELQVYFSKINQ